jgi:TetR/AcrR family transcriptional regulator, cholesterol catabolism regulator
MPDTQPVARERTAPAHDRRAAIAEMAARLFDERGYHSTSMEDIAENVGLRKPSLYHYFKSKDEILFYVHNRMIDLILDRHERRRSAGVESSGSTIRSMMRDIIELMETHPGHLRVFFEHHRELPEDYQRMIRTKRNQFRQHVSDVIRQGIADGEFRDVDVDLTTLAVLGMSNWTYQWLHPGSPHSVERVTDHFWEIFMRGVSTDPSWGAGAPPPGS